MLRKEDEWFEPGCGNWNRAFYAQRCDAPLCATAVVSGGHVAGILPAGTPEVVGPLTARLKDRCERPMLLPGQHR